MATLVSESFKAKIATGTAGMIKPPVTIMDNFGHVDKQAIVINDTEQVEWINNTGHQVQIVLDEAPPFAGWNDPFIIPAKSKKGSGLLKPPVLYGHRYKYTVIGKEGNTDPVIIIEP